MNVSITSSNYRCEIVLSEAILIALFLDHSWILQLAQEVFR